MAKQPETAAPTEQKPLDIFERQKIKAALVNRVYRALKAALDDNMRRDIIAEVSSLSNLIGAKE